MRKFEDYDIHNPSNKDGAIINDKGEVSIKETNPIEMFLRATGKGLTFDNACKFAKLVPSVVREWLTKAQEYINNDPYTTNKYTILLERYNYACAIFEGQTLEAITNAAKNGNWNAAAWLLERRLPEQYSSKQDVKINNENLVVKLDIGKANGDNKCK